MVYQQVVDVMKARRKMLTHLETLEATHSYTKKKTILARDTCGKKKKKIKLLYSQAENKLQLGGKI